MTPIQSIQVAWRPCQYNYQMLVIQNTKIKFQKTVFPVKIKTITIGYNQSYSTNQKKYQQVSTHLFEWTEAITLPLYYNVPLEFTCKTDQNYDNPEDPNSLITAKIKIIDYKQVHAEGALMNRLNEKVATLTIAFKVLNERLIVPEDKGRLLISSILAHFENHYGSKGFMEIAIGFKTLFTPTVNVIAGQLLWSEELAVPLQETSTFKGTKEELVMKIIVDEKIIGIVKFKVEAIRNLNLKYKKFKIADAEDESKKIGILFLDITYKERLQKEEKAEPNQYSLSLKKKEPVFGKKQSSQRILHNPSLLAFRSEEKESSRSERMLPLISGTQSTHALLVPSSLLDKQKSSSRKKPQIFSSVFNLGEKEQNIRQIFKQRRKKQTLGSLPRLK